MKASKAKPEEVRFAFSDLTKAAVLGFQIYEALQSLEDAYEFAQREGAVAEEHAERIEMLESAAGDLGLHLDDVKNMMAERAAAEFRTLGQDLHCVSLLIDALKNHQRFGRLRR